MVDDQKPANLSQRVEEGNVDSVLERTRANKNDSISFLPFWLDSPSDNLLESISMLVLPVQLLQGHLGGSLARLGQKCKRLDQISRDLWLRIVSRSRRENRILPGLCKIIHMVAHGHKQIEVELVTNFHLLLHGSALLEDLAASNDHG